MTTPLDKILGSLPSPSSSWLMSDKVTRVLEQFRADREAEAQAPVRWCGACQRYTPSNETCPFCASTVGDDSMCHTCQQTVAPLAVCADCGIPREVEDEVGLLRLEVRRLEALNATNANTVQALRLVLMVLADNPTFSVRVACERAGIDYDTYLLRKRSV